jgi:hypothetical protein
MARRSTPIRAIRPIRRALAALPLLALASPALSQSGLERGTDSIGATRPDVRDRSLHEDRDQNGVPDRFERDRLDSTRFERDRMERDRARMERERMDREREQREIPLDRDASDPTRRPGAVPETTP